MNKHFFILAKAVSWPITGTLITAGITYGVTGKLSFALYVSAMEFAVKIGVFYCHERFWESLAKWHSSFYLHQKQKI